MINLLAIVSDFSLLKDIEKLAIELGCQPHVAKDFKSALALTETVDFDVVITEPMFSYSEEGRLADRVWSKKIDALYLVIDNNAKINESEERMNGIEVINIKDISTKLHKYLKNYFRNPNQGKGDFNILVVDDLPSPRDIICMYLEHLGAKAFGVSSVAEAIQLLSADNQPYSCVFTDIKMPLASGVDLINFVRKKDSVKHLPVIVLTALSSSNYLMDCLKAGASGFLAKPPKREDLVREIGKAKRIIKCGLDPRLIRSDKDVISEDFLLSKGIV